ncbi:MAG: hydrogenase maturation nickel metallochaperone HypA [Sphaerochaeta sp.]|jgi:hydrogenase nickel incorporation protein HypA/HybF
MHELTILVELVDMVENAMSENHIDKIDTVVVQIGQLSSIVPRYMKEYYPNACSGSKLEGSKLKIEMIPGNGLCHHCNKVFNVIKSKGRCPICNADDWEMLSGQEFMLKEIYIKQDASQ